MAEILDGKKIKKEKILELGQRVAKLDTKLTLAVLQVGNRKDSDSYIASKKKCAEKIGVNVIHHQFPENVRANEVEAVIEQLNIDTSVHGILLQLPLPPTLDKDQLLNAIVPHKDVDGLGAVNTARLFEGREDAIIPATTRGILLMLEYYHIPLEGRKVTMVGRSSLVGKPTAIVCSNHNATVTLCHSKTLNLREETKSADILIVAIGKPHFITKDFVKPGQVVIDVGINSPTMGKLDEEVVLPKLIGDVEYSEVKEIVDKITPVPGGVGQLTVVSLFENLIDVYNKGYSH